MTKSKLKKIGSLSLIALFLVIMTPSAAYGLDVGTIERPPFATKGQDGKWTGYTVELVEEIATRNQLEINWVEQDVFANMISRTASGELKLSAANISVTAEREDTLDFSTPVYESGLQIFVPASAQSPSMLSLLWSSGIIQFVGLAFLILLIVAHMVWWFERDHDGQDYFRDDYRGGIWDAFWWAFIIVTIGGFENERPQKLIGRVIAIFWILASIFFISTFTAKITTSLTVAQLQTDISTYEDLRGKNVGAPKGTTISAFLDKQNISYTEYDDFSAVLTDVENEVLEAGVGDAAVVQFYAANEGRNKVVSAGDVFADDLIAIAFPEDSELLELFNKGLAQLREDGTRTTIFEAYFGQPE